jgi:hypothetical protein
MNVLQSSSNWPFITAEEPLGLISFDERALLLLQMMMSKGRTRDGGSFPFGRRIFERLQEKRASSQQIVMSQEHILIDERASCWCQKENGRKIDILHYYFYSKDTLALVWWQRSVISSFHKRPNEKRSSSGSNDVIPGSYSVQILK